MVRLLGGHAEALAQTRRRVYQAKVIALLDLPHEGPDLGRVYPEAVKNQGRCQQEQGGVLGMAYHRLL